MSSIAYVHVDLTDSDDLELGRLTGQLRDELAELDVDGVARSSEGVAPHGAKGDPTGVNGEQQQEIIGTFLAVESAAERPVIQD